VLEIPTLIPRVFSGKAATVARHRKIEIFREVTEGRITSTDDRPFPVQVDGDYIGDFEELELGVAPAALMAVA
jgi:diacylglycerol kinase family enzyme